jgi:hypothetical protein
MQDEVVGGESLLVESDSGGINIALVLFDGECREGEGGLKLDDMKGRVSEYG